MHPLLLGDRAGELLDARGDPASGAAPSSDERLARRERGRLRRARRARREGELVERVREVARVGEVPLRERRRAGEIEEREVLRRELQIGR